jgi:hypothetical protein
MINRVMAGVDTPTSFPRHQCGTAPYPATPRVVDLGTLRCSPRAGQIR